MINDHDRELAKRAVEAMPAPPCGTFVEMANWRQQNWLEPFAKAIANARAEERERCADLAKDILKKLVGPMEAGYVASKILGKDVPPPIV
jgi:hypothetical protein